MMTHDETTRISKLLSLILRHRPEKVGLTLKPGGWISVTDLLHGCAAHGIRLTLAQLIEVVETSEKQRFGFDESRAHIRANQGHSVEVDLQLMPTTPPDILYHGTGAKSVEAIHASGGLKPMRRHHVHLSGDILTATTVGARHGEPVVFKVDARSMHEAGHRFFVSANGVWLTDWVPSRYLDAL